MNRQHDHDAFQARLDVLTATFHAAEQLALQGVISASDLLARRSAALQELRDLSIAPNDPGCSRRREQAVREIAAD